MKVVINVRHGGFGLSQAAYYKLIEWGVPAHLAGSSAKSARAHPMLVRVVEELGVEAAGNKLAKLKIVEIPKDVEWEIEECNGCEWIAEKHRVWGAES